jgi:hypothetical protein
MMNRICGAETSSSSASKKKSRLEALAASRERELGPDTDSDQEEETNSPGAVKGNKAKAARKLSRSVPSKGNINFFVFFGFLKMGLKVE